jgi:hypothetical protein
LSRGRWKLLRIWNRNQVFAVADTFRPRFTSTAATQRGYIPQHSLPACTRAVFLPSTRRIERLAWADPVRSLLAESDDAKGAATVVIVAGGEEELIVVAVRTSRAALAELNGPDIVDLNGLAARVTKWSEESAGLGIKSVDAPPGSVIRDEKRIAHRPKVSRCQSDAPRRMERTVHGKVRLQNACGREGVHKSSLRFVEGSIGDPNRFRAIRSGDRLNAIGSELLRDAGVDKSVRTEIGYFEIGVEYVDPTVLAVIGGVQKFLSIVRGDG